MPLSFSLTVSKSFDICTNDAGGCFPKEQVYFLLQNKTVCWEGLGRGPEGWMMSLFSASRSPFEERQVGSMIVGTALRETSRTVEEVEVGQPMLTRASSQFQERVNWDNPFSSV